MSTSLDALDDIQTLLDAMRSRRGEMKLFEGLLENVATALENIQSLMERAQSNGDDDGEPDDSVASAITDGLRGLSFPAPQITVHVPEQTAPTIVVQPAAVTIMPSDSQSPMGWVLRVIARDENGRPAEISFKPEN